MTDRTDRVRRCTECGLAQTLTHVTTRYPESGLSNVELINVPAWVCPNGHEEIQIPAISQLHDLLTHVIVRKPAKLVGAEVKFLRKQAGLSAIEFSRRLGITSVHISRLENGKRHVSRPLDLLIRLSIAGLIASRTNKPFPSDLAPLVEMLESFDLGTHRLRHVDAGLSSEEWQEAGGI